MLAAQPPNAEIGCGVFPFEGGVIMFSNGHLISYDPRKSAARNSSACQSEASSVSFTLAIARSRTSAASFGIRYVRSTHAEGRSFGSWGRAGRSRASQVKDGNP